MVTVKTDVTVNVERLVRQTAIPDARLPVVNLVKDVPAVVIPTVLIHVVVVVPVLSLLV